MKLRQMIGRMYVRNARRIPNPVSHTRFVTWFLCAVSVLFCSRCGDGSREVNTSQAPRPRLVVIGEDLSGTFEGYTAITAEDLQNLCKHVAETPAGGTVYFMGIGNSTPQGYAKCELKAIPPLDPGLAPSRRKTAEKAAAQVGQHNDAAINAFLDEAQAIMQQKGQPNTDINGFFKKAGAVARSANFKRHERWLFVNSDCRQDTPKSKRVDCNALGKSFGRFYISSSWTREPTCSPKGDFFTVQEFIDFFAEATASSEQDMTESPE